MDDYVKGKAGDIFFDGTDEIVEKFKSKISATEAKIQLLESEIKGMVESQKDRDPF